MNCYSTFTLDDWVKCSAEDAEELIRILKQAADEVEDPADEKEHGISVHFIDGEVLLNSSDAESAEPCNLPDAFLEKFGEVLTKAGLPHVGWGVARTADKQRAGTHGGSIGRIYADGFIEVAQPVFFHGAPKTSDDIAKIEALIGDYEVAQSRLYTYEACKDPAVAVQRDAAVSLTVKAEQALARLGAAAALQQEAEQG